jgi:hypothetical protein
VRDRQLAERVLAPVLLPSTAVAWTPSNVDAAQYQANAIALSRLADTNRHPEPAAAKVEKSPVLRIKPSKGAPGGELILLARDTDASD